MEALLHILEHSVLDTLTMLPFLFGTFVLMEYLEHRAAGRMKELLAGRRRLGPVVGSVLGLVPQCGFSVVAANLYAGRLISLGTLVAVFVATSDEAIPVLLSRPDSWGLIGQLMAVKLVLAAVAGLLVDACYRPAPVPAADREEEACGCHHDHEGGILRHALRHTLRIYGFVLLATVLLQGGIELLGEERLASLLLGGTLLQPVAAALLGLIPNCAASIILTSLYLEGGLSFGALVAGLSTGAGVGLMVLLRANRRPKENLAIIGLLVALGAGAGMVLQLLG